MLQPPAAAAGNLWSKVPNFTVEDQSRPAQRATPSSLPPPFLHSAAQLRYAGGTPDPGSVEIQPTPIEIEEAARAAAHP